MIYKARDDRYAFYHSQELSNTNTESIPHTWTIGKEYEIDLDRDLNTVSFTSDIGAANDIPVLLCNAELMQNVFGIDISDMIESANKINSESVLQQIIDTI